jgi:MFS family permease
MVNPRLSPAVLWGQVAGLAAVQGAITLSWVIYNLYLVQLLTGLGFPQGWAAGILVLENLMAIVMEPLMGSFSDRLQHQVGTRFPLISLGVVLAAGLFLGIPTVALWGQGSFLRWVLPLLLIAWALAMTVFRSPALSLLGRYAFRTHLPQAASILTLVGGLSGAMGPLASPWILGLGPLFAFAAGSAVLLLATLALGWVGPSATVDVPPREAVEPKPLSWPALALVFGAGVGITLGFRLLITAFPVVLREQVPGANVAAIMGTIFIALALTAIPAGTIARRMGNQRAMVLGLAAMALLAVVMVSIRTSAVGVVLAVLFGSAFSLVANGTLPFALAMVPPEKAGLGTGMYFSGGALALSLWGLLFGSSSPTPGLSGGLGALAFLLAGVCVGLAGRYRSPSVVDG